MKFRLEEIEVPEDEPFKNDALKRQPVVEFVRDLIKQLEGPFVLALDSPWGTGKTTVVRMLRASLKKDGITSVYFNAWKEDYVSDPLIPMVAAIDELQVADPEAGKQFGERMATVKKVASKVAKRGLVAAVKLATLNTVDLDEVVEDVLASSAGEVADDVIESFKQEKASLDRFRDALDEAVKTIDPDETSKPLVFFIDELDRCRPTFAIELLERVKHLFDVKHIVFVLSIDKKQLEAITAAVYGERMDAAEYLRRFVDLEFSLPSTDSQSVTSSLIERFGLTPFFQSRKQYRNLAYDEEQFVDAFSALAGAFALSLRARERCMTRLSVVLHQTKPDHYLDPILVAFLIVLRVKRADHFEGLVNGSVSPDEILEFLWGLPGVVALKADRVALVLAAYLHVGDPDIERRERRFREFGRLVASGGDSPDVVYAHDIIEIRDHIRPLSSGRNFNLLHVAKKIDLVARLDQ